MLCIHNVRTIPSSSPHSSFPTPPAVHTILCDLLPPSTYFRFNPELSSDVPIDESTQKRLDELVSDAERYIVANREHLDRAAACLLEPKWARQKAREWAGLQWSRALCWAREIRPAG